MSEYAKALEVIEANARDFSRKRESGEEVLFAVMLREVGELASAILDVHEDSPQYELIQIGGVVLNMLSQYRDETLLLALASIRKKHGICNKEA